MSLLSAWLARVRLWHVLLVFTPLALWSSILIPLGEGPDELPHYTVTRYIVRHGHLPDTPEEHEAFQPPLYYLLSAALTFWINTDDFVVKANADYDPRAPDAPKMLLLHTRAEAFPYQSWALAWHLMRLSSVLMGIGTVTALYATARALTGEQGIALAVAASVAFLPGFIYLSAVVNNDNLSALIAALLCWQMVALLKRGGVPPNARALGLGLLLGLGFLSKTSMLVFGATFGLCLLAAARLHRWRTRDWLRVIALAYGLATLVSGWYFVRNTLVFGDPLAWSLVLAANAVRTEALDAGAWLSALAQVFRSYWLDWNGIALPAPILALLALFVALALAGGVLAFARSRRDTRYWSAWFRAHAALLLLIVHLLLVGASWMRWTQTVLGTEQARLFYPALATINVCFVLGVRSAHRALPAALVLTLLGLALVAPVAYVAPVYAPAARIADLPSGAQPISATFKDKLRLIGWDISAKRLRPGDVLRVGLYWESLKDLTEDDWLRLQLLDARDQFLMFKDGSPSAGRDSTDSWRRGERIASLHRLVIPPQAPPGAYRLTVGIHPYGRKNWFPIEEENMWIALSDQLVLAEVHIE